MSENKQGWDSKFKSNGRTLIFGDLSEEEQQKEDERLLEKARKLFMQEKAFCDYKNKLFEETKNPAQLNFQNQKK